MGSAASNLKAVDAKLLETSISAVGAIVSRPNEKGRTVNVDVTIADGRVQDVLRLAVRGSKPVMWSVVEKTALAEAEVEYEDYVSDQVWVKFPLRRPAAASHPELAAASILIWTTTPWTIPGNRALAYGKDIAYGLVEVAAVGEGSKARAGEKMVLAKDLVGAVAETGKFTAKVVADVSADDLEGLIAAHPLRGQGYDFDVRLLEGSFVTADAGTGFVHIAPGHGADDYELGIANGVEVPDTVADIIKDKCLFDYPCEVPSMK